MIFRTLATLFMCCAVLFANSAEAVVTNDSIQTASESTKQAVPGERFNIKQLIGIAKEAKLKNSAPIKYHIEIANSFWNNIFKVKGITDREYPIPSIIDIVNSIRLAKGNVFAEWKQSDTAKLSEGHGDKNKKESGGYFL